MKGRLIKSVGMGGDGVQRRAFNWSVKMAKSEEELVERRINNGSRWMVSGKRIARGNQLLWKTFGK